MEQTGRPLDPQELLSHREWIRGLARRLVADEHTAEDVAQDVLETALARRPPLLRSLRGWLASVTRSRAIDRQRADRARAVRERATRPRRAPSTADLVARADAQRAVAAAVTQLAEPYRTTVLLRHFQELTPTEIGERTGVPRETVKTRLRRAHAMLRAKLDAEFGGERDRWRAVLLLLPGLLEPPGPAPSPARPGVPTATATTAAGTAGALVMTTTSKLAVVAVAALLLFAGAAAVTVLREDAATPPEREATESAAEVQSGRVRAPTPPAKARTLVGRVRRRCDGAPVTNASLVLRVAGGRDVRVASGRDGGFALDAPAGAAEILVVRARGYAPETVSLRDGTGDLGTVWIAAGTRLVVTVAGEDGAPARDVTVAAARRKPVPGHIDSFLFGMTDLDSRAGAARAAPTDATGTAVFEGLPPGSWFVFVADAALASTSRVHVPIHPGTEEVRAALSVSRLASLRGRVLDAGGSPVEGALVTAIVGLELRPPQRARTAATGHFRLTALPAGVVTLNVDRGRGPGATLARVRVPEVETIDLVLPPTGRLVGRVIDGAGRPLEGRVVRIEVSGIVQSLTSATSGADGRYEFPAVTVGTITRFRVFADDLVQRWARTEGGELVGRGDARLRRRRAEITPGGTTTIDVQLVRGGVITGSVSGPDGPLAGVHVWRWRVATHAGQDWASTTTGDDGTFRFPPDLPGPVALEVRHPALYQPGLPEDVTGALRRGEVPERFLVTIPAAGDVSMDLRVALGGAVRGRVEDESGAPVAGASVFAFEYGFSDVYDRSVRTDAAGAFVLEHVRPGRSRRISARAMDGAAKGAVRVEVPPGGVADDVIVRVARAASPSATEAVTRKLTGRVLLAGSGRPVEGARVAVLTREPVMMVGGMRFKGNGQGDVVVAVSDADGRFECALRGPGPFWIAAESAGTIGEVVEVTADSRTVEIRARRALPVSGHVRDVEGTPLVGATIVAAPGYRGDEGDRILFLRPMAGTTRAGQPRVTRTRADGSFTIHGVPEGTCKLTVFRAAEVADRSTAMAARGTSFGPFMAGAAGLDLRFDRPQRAALRLRVVYPDGSPVVRASIGFAPEGGSERGSFGIDAADGRIEIPDTADPSYVVRVTSFSEPYTTRVFRGLAPGDVEHELVLAPGVSISGRVLDAAGAPVAGIAISARPEGVSDPISWYSATTNADGTFTLWDVEPRKYELQTGADAAGARRRLLERVRASGGESGVTLRTTLEGRVRGVVVDPDGAPVAGVRLRFMRPAAAGVWGTVPSTITDERGRFEMTGLDPATVWSVEPQVTPPVNRTRYDLRRAVEIGNLNVRLVVPAQE